MSPKFVLLSSNVHQRVFGIPLNVTCVGTTALVVVAGTSGSGGTGSPRTRRESSMSTLYPHKDRKTRRRVEAAVQHGNVAVPGLRIRRNGSVVGCDVAAVGLVLPHPGRGKLDLPRDRGAGVVALELAELPLPREHPER